VGISENTPNSYELSVVQEVEPIGGDVVGVVGADFDDVGSRRKWCHGGRRNYVQSHSSKDSDIQVVCEESEQSGSERKRRRRGGNPKFSDFSKNIQIQEVGEGSESDSSHRRTRHLKRRKNGTHSNWSENSQWFKKSVIEWQTM
jgi:hypothetical protein